MLWFAESVKNALVFVDPLVEFSLQFVLGHADKEVSNQLWNRFAHRPDSDLENGVDTRSNFFYKDVCASSVRLLCRRLLLLLRDWHAVLVVLWSHDFLLRHNRSAIFFVVRIVNEQVVLL